MVDVSQLQNMDYGFEAYATQAFNSPDGRALAVSWLGLQMFLTLLIVLTTKEPSLWSRNSLSKTANSTNTQSQLSRTFVLLKKPSQTVFKPITLTNSNSNLEANSQSEIVLLADKEGKGLSINFDLVNGQVTVDRSQAGEQYAQDLGQSFLPQSITRLLLLQSSSITLSLKFSSIKEKKYFLVVSSHMRTKMVSWSNLETQLELTMN